MGDDAEVLVGGGNARKVAVERDGNSKSVHKGADLLHSPLPAVFSRTIEREEYGEWIDIGPVVFPQAFRADGEKLFTALRRVPLSHFLGKGLVGVNPLERRLVHRFSSREGCSGRYEIGSYEKWAERRYSKDGSFLLWRVMSLAFKIALTAVQFRALLKMSLPLARSSVTWLFR